MLKNRRWLFTSTGQAILASLAGSSLLAADPKTGAARTSTPTPCPSLVDIPTPASYDEARNDLRKCFYEGVCLRNGTKPVWGLNPSDIPPEKLLDPKMDLLGKDGGHLEQHYRERLKKHIDAKSIPNYGLLREQAALLGSLTRCMYDTYPLAGGFDPRHLNWAREALGFALNGNTDMQDTLFGKCKFRVSKGRQTDQPCALC